jgi:predicted ATPase
MINFVRVNFGSSPTAVPLALDPRPITVFVGPNNSGKSLALREIETWCKAGPQQQRKIVAEIDVDLPDAEQALTELEPFKRRPGVVRNLGRRPLPTK